MDRVTVDLNPGWIDSFDCIRSPDLADSKIELSQRAGAA